MKRYPWTWDLEECRGDLIWTYGGVGGSLVFMLRVPPDTARRRLRRRQMETLAALVLTAKRMGKEVR